MVLDLTPNEPSHCVSCQLEDETSDISDESDEEGFSQIVDHTDPERNFKKKFSQMKSL